MDEKAWKLVLVEERPFNAEAPLAALAEPLTPTRLFYVRNHFDVPHIDVNSWRLTIGGAVGAPLAYSLNDLQRLAERTVIVTLECAGNGRTAMTPTPSGTPWGLGAVSSARFTGTPLHLLLDQAQLQAAAGELLFTGADQGEVEPGRRVPFARSLPLAVARQPDTLLAWAMNGEPLLPEHGFPLRLIVPRWYGVASVKWLLDVSLLAAPFKGYFQGERYIFVGERGTPLSAATGTPVTAMRVRAVIAQPADGARLGLGPVELQGIAWSGVAPISRVDVSVDDGQSWTAAELGTPLSPYAAAPWRFLWLPPMAGAHTLMARATDEAGNTQPLEPLWNAHGYGNNGVRPVHVTVGHDADFG